MGGFINITIKEVIVQYDDKKLDLIIHKLNQMSQDAAAIKQLLIDADLKADRIAADVAALHALIEALGDAPSPAEIQEIKDLSTALNNKLQGIDDSTPE